MSLNQYSSTSLNLKPRFDDDQWVIQIRNTLEEELESEIEIPVSIFSVPKLLMASDPESYTPQEVSIGPYHHWSPQLYEMERYKLAAAKRLQKQLQGCKFDHVVDQIGDLEHKIRACCHKVLEVSNEALAWMMAIDASFLLEFLHVYAVKEGAKAKKVSSRMSHLVDYARTKSTHNAILRDMVMLQNQIPLMVLRKLLEVQFSSLDTADEMLGAMFMGFSKDLSPVKMVQDLPSINVSQCSHLLDYLYDLIVPKLEAPPEITGADDQDQGEAIDKEKEESYAEKSSQIAQLFSELWEIVSKLDYGPVVLLKKLIFSGPVKVILELPWTTISNLPGISKFKQPVESLFFSDNKEGSKEEGEGSNNNEATNNPPLIEEMAIPSVTELSKSGVRFLPTNGNLLSINFDPKKLTLYLPIVSLDVNTEVVLRNLVAYEASNASGPLVLTRYTELMNGIIDTEEDAKLLREKGIILNHLKTDKEVADLWNGMSKSIKLTKVPFLDKVIEDVNKHYNNRWKAKAGKFMKSYVFGSWQILTLLACICLLGLMTLQAFCSVYSCSRIFNITTTST